MPCLLELTDIKLSLFSHTSNVDGIMTSPGQSQLQHQDWTITSSTAGDICNALPGRASKLCGPTAKRKKRLRFAGFGTARSNTACSAHVTNLLTS